MRLGIFGGTFDPIHIGHLVAAQVTLEEAELDRVLFVPAGVNPLKVGRESRTGEHRLNMVRAAIGDHPQFAVEDWELKQPGPSFTVNTLEYLQGKYPDAELYLIIGADNLHILPKWRAVDQIVKIATILAVTRPGFELQTNANLMFPELSKRVQYVEIPGLDISSTWIRERLVKNQSVEHLLAPPVIRYIKEQGLYGRIEG